MTEHEARSIKARKLADALWSAGIKSAQARLMDDYEWRQLARVARCHPPHSDATKEAIYTILDIPRGWETITDVPCHFACGGTLRWAENGYVPGYRICEKCGRHYQFRRLGRYSGGLTADSIRFNGRRSPILPSGKVSFFASYEERMRA